MATGGAAFQFLFLNLLISCLYGASSASMNFHEHTDLEKGKQHLQALHFSRKDVQNHVPSWVNPINHDQLMEDLSPPTTPVTNPVTTPVTNPVTTPANLPPAVNFPPAGIVTVPATTPTPSAQTPPTPVSTPLPVPSTNPNPVNTPLPAVTNPVTTPAGAGGLPVTPPAAATNPPAVAGGGQSGSWCVARSGVPEITLQSALDYACGIGGADCSTIQQSGSCYNPNSLQNHASFAFNSYYQKNPVPTSCDFGGAAMVTSTNPSSGSCVYPTSGSSSSSSPSSSSSSSSPPTQNPTPSAPITTPTTPPTTASSSGTGLLPDSGTPPPLLNASYPVPGGEMPGMGDGIPLGNTSTISMSPINLQPFVGCIFLVASICTGTLALRI
ncbi:PREDICTED: mucin-2-like [Ipomoea nil]|uniref:mucin-2-like n=1 Tax=Ipomoea nil TaxID=35883 RepID=UPI000901648A|nr:PREDICTED: mucin-2-like [Ipomoea nil]XP_019187617.1 PREDICTED: mucin-2-like [Ipomoea nil]